MLLRELFSKVRTIRALPACLETRLGNRGIADRTSDRYCGVGGPSPPVRTPVPRTARSAAVQVELGTVRLQPQSALSCFKVVAHVFASEKPPPSPQLQKHFEPSHVSS